MDENQNVNIESGGASNNSKSHGALIGSIIIIAILVIGAIYLLSNKADYLKNSEPTEEKTGENVVGEDLNLSSSDELNDLEADLNATSDFELDQGLE